MCQALLCVRLEEDGHGSYSHGIFRQRKRPLEDDKSCHNIVMTFAEALLCAVTLPSALRGASLLPCNSPLEELLYYTCFPAGETKAQRSCKLLKTLQLGSAHT